MSKSPGTKQKSELGETMRVMGRLVAMPHKPHVVKKKPKKQRPNLVK
jgi:hypothetical protein